MEGPERGTDAQEAYREFIHEICNKSFLRQAKVRKILDFFRSNMNGRINLTELSEKIGFPVTTLWRWMQEIRNSVQNQWTVPGAAQGLTLQTGGAPPERNSWLLGCARQQVPFHEAGSVANQYLFGDSSGRPVQTRHISFPIQHPPQRLQSCSSLADAVQVVFTAQLCISQPCSVTKHEPIPVREYNSLRIYQILPNSGKEKNLTSPVALCSADSSAKKELRRIGFLA